MVSKQFLLLWCQTACNPKGIAIKNFSSSFSGGVALCAILHYYKPSLFHWSNVDQNDPQKTIKIAFDAAEKAGIEIFLDIEDLSEPKPEALSVFTQVLEFYINLRNVVRPATIGKRGPRVNFMQTMSRPLKNKKKVLTLNTQLKKNRRSIQLAKSTIAPDSTRNPSSPIAIDAKADISTDVEDSAPVVVPSVSIPDEEEAAPEPEPEPEPEDAPPPETETPETETETTSTTQTVDNSVIGIQGAEAIDMEDTFSFQITGITTQQNKQQQSFTQISFTYVITSGSEELTIGFARTWEECVQLRDRMVQLFPETSSFTFPKVKSSLFGKKPKTFKIGQIKDINRNLSSYFESLFSSELYRDSAYVSSFINPSFTVDYDQLDSIIKEGPMSKRGHKSTGWRNRHFVLSGKSLYYYKKKHDQTPRGSIILSGCTYADKDTPYPTTGDEEPIVKVVNAAEFALVTPGGVPVIYHIKASNGEERDSWKEALVTVINQV